MTPKEFLEATIETQKELELDMTAKEWFESKILGSKFLESMEENQEFSTLALMHSLMVVMMAVNAVFLTPKKDPTVN